MDKRRLNLRILASPGTFFSFSGQSEGDPLFLRPAISQLGLGKLLEVFRRMTQSTRYRLLLCTTGFKVFTRMVAEDDENRRNCVIHTLGKSHYQFKDGVGTIPSVPATDATSRHLQTEIFHFPSLPIMEAITMSKICYVCGKR
ncbi:hypothetical protein BDV34DRAFT_217236 [Aspergillus parasiticus]|uniref:Uncharacterized protein n=2 Tax=Aspergillus subgen. Circumdati TaxID=2720871 RepID=A0A5N6D5N0_ASPPA|nr:hypothetical protein BDV34DRAFT_217236 [Aspergillus parasiticus]KAE8340898.1 hypothetical protein BDV24DRAFT_151568 [Aspergillus arachidicola]